MIIVNRAVDMQDFTDMYRRFSAKGDFSAALLTRCRSNRDARFKVSLFPCSIINDSEMLRSLAEKFDNPEMTA